MTTLGVSLLEFCYTEKIANLRNAVFRESPDVIYSCLYFLLPGYWIRISHSTDFMLAVDTGSFFAFFCGEGDFEGINSVPRSKQASETPFI